MLLHEFIITNRDELAFRIDAKGSSRPWPSATTAQQHGGIPLFLTQLCETLLGDSTTMGYPDGAIGVSAAEHGRDLLAKGYTISQVVHDYGDVCQAVTELAADKRATISAEEFHTLNRCLDTAIAEAVTEYSRIEAHAASLLEIERLGHMAHELRNVIQAALLSFEVLKSGRVGITGSAGAVLGRSLIGLRDLIDRAVSEARLSAAAPTRERVSLLEDAVLAAIDHRPGEDPRGVQARGARRSSAEEARGEAQEHPGEGELTRSTPGACERPPSGAALLSGGT